MEKKLSKLLKANQIPPPLTGSSKINVGTNERLLSAAGGALLTYFGLKNKGTINKLLAVVGSSLLVRSATGYCPVNDMADRNSADKDPLSIEITRSLTINKPRSEVYAYWRELENLPKFMKHLKEVRPIDDTISYWIAPVPGGMGTVAWEAELIQEKEHELLAWQSMPGSDIDNAGEVRFKDAPAGRGTVIQATISYRAPEGDLGGNVAKLLNPVFKQMVKEDLRRFKRLIETGEILTIEGQPSGRS